jgi:aryl-phospho-beta-D-glucosidase BglC (GH1 family)
MSSHLSIILICAFILLFAILFLRYIWQDPEKRAYFTQRRKPKLKMDPPTPADILRYRYHHGANLGSVFILERWLTPSMFASCNAAGTSELAAVESSVKQIGLEGTRAGFEKHWKDYIVDPDLDWLRDAKCTTVRLPIGYFTLGPGFCQTTPFKAVAPVYLNAWSAVKELVQRCGQRGIGVLIDMHGLPSGANDQDHSGTNSGKAELWGNQVNLALATRCVCFVVEQVKAMAGVVG